MSNDLLDRIGEVVPLIAARAADAEEQRKPDDDVIAALCGTGVFRSFVPKQYGGYEIDLELFVDIGVAISEACPSTGWITTFYMEHNWLLGLFDEDVRAEVFAERGYVLMPGTVNPSGEATKRHDHYELTGHWQFGTGIVHADWVLLSGRIVGEDFPRMFLVPASEVEVKDTWYVDGMVATGSRDIVATAVPVPLDHVSNLRMTGSKYLSRFPVRPFLSLTAAIPAVGCARRAVSLFQARLPERVLFGTNKRQSETSAAQIRLGNLTVRTALAEQAMRAAASEMGAYARGELVVTPLDEARLRTTIAHLVRQCRDVVRDVMEASGAGAHYLYNEIQRLHRDAHMMAAHTVFDVDSVAGEYGRALLKDLG